MSAALQFTLPLFRFGDEGIEKALVEVVIDEKEHRPRVQPVGLTGWVKFPTRLRNPGAIYEVELLKPRPGGAWTATGRIRRVT